VGNLIFGSRDFQSYPLDGDRRSTWLKKPLSEALVAVTEQEPAGTAAEYDFRS